GWREASSADKGRALLTGLSLAEGLDLARRWGPSLDQNLASFIQTSHKAATRRRRQIVGASLAASVIFAMIAAVALLQRREAVAAAEVARRETAASLAAQSSGLVEHNDVEGALRLAIKAAGVDPDIGSRHLFPVSEPALLGAMAIDRQVLHLDMPHHVYPLMPVRFLDNATMVWVTPGAVVMVVGLHPSPHVIRRIVLPGMKRPRQMAVAGGRFAVIGGKDRVVIVDCANGKIKTTIMTGNWVNDVDIDAASGAIAIALPDKLLLTGLNDAATPRLLHLPAAAASCDISQARFARDGKALFVACGPEVYVVNIATGNADAAPVAALDMSVVGITPGQLGKMLHTARGGAHLERVVADQTGGNGILTLFPAELRAYTPGSAAPVVIARHGPYFLGLGFTRAAGATTKSMVVTRGQRGATRETFTLQYVLRDSKRLLPPFETFSVPVRLFANASLDHCQISPQGSYLLCQYFGGGREGFYVWLTGGGAHREERLTNQYGDAARPMQGTGALALLNGAGGLKMRRADGTELRLGALLPALKPVRVTTAFIAALDDVGQRVVIASFGPKAGSLHRVVPLMSGVDARFGPARHKVIITGHGSLSAFSLPEGKSLWTRALASAPWSSALSADGRSFAVATAGAITTYNAETGRPAGKIAIPGALAGLTLFDHFATRLAYADKGGQIHIVSLPDGKAIVLAKSGMALARLAFSRDGAMLLAGHRDGSITAFDSAGHRLWRIASPLNGAFSEQQAMPGRPPRGVVLRMAFSPGGRRLAVIREQLAELDLYDTGSGTLLTHLSSPWSFGEPAAVHLGSGGLIASAWATLPQLLDKPRRVMLHQIPTHFADILALARRRLQGLQETWPADRPAAATAKAQEPAAP
ncbi:MAG: WD40 repeat domain-containing protein, partial [Hyphomicrobiales bacterium]|nr:WD40 repeat domain-containing protein [Hyphomicrobiales bacterium]